MIGVPLSVPEVGRGDMLIPVPFQPRGSSLLPSCVTTRNNSRGRRRGANRRSGRYDLSIRIWFYFGMGSLQMGTASNPDEFLRNVLK